LEPIPTPSGLRWREFRQTIMPSVVFVATLAAVGFIWNAHVAAPTLIGEVEAIRSEVVSVVPGRLDRLMVGAYAEVHAGDPIAEVVTTEPKVLEASLAVIRAEIEFLRASSDPILKKESLQIDFQHLQLLLLNQRTEIGNLRIRLQYANSELERVRQLFETAGSPGVASKEAYEIAQRDQKVIVEEIASREALIAEVERNVHHLRFASNTNAVSPDPDDLVAAIKLQEEKLRLTAAQLAPRILTAPIDGFVSLVHRHTGDNLVAGEPIVTITSPRSERILSYVIPPISAPKVGSTVEVIARTTKRERSRATILGVAGHMDIVAPTLFNPVNSNTRGLNNEPLSSGKRLVEIGVPIAISMPPNLSLRPGELVDLRLLGAGH